MITLPLLKRAKRLIIRLLPPLNFITIHYAYFIGTSLLSGIIFWGSSTPARSVTFTDAIFLTTSAMTEAGLNTVNLSTLNIFQQVIIFVLMLMGSSIFVSAFVVLVRLRAFEMRFKEVIEYERQFRELLKGSSRNHFSFSTISRIGNLTALEEEKNQPPLSATCDDSRDPKVELGSSSNARENAAASIGTGILPGDETKNGYKARSDLNSAVTDVPPKHLATEDNAPENTRGIGPRTISFGVETKPFLIGRPLRPRDPYESSSSSSNKGIGARFAHFHLAPHNDPLESNAAGVPYVADGFDLPAIPHPKSVGRNSQLHHLSHLDRLRIGGVEYRAIRILGWLVPTYFALWQIFGCIGLGVWITKNRPSVARENGSNPFWAGAFNAVSAFNNNGYSLIDANMTAFQTADYMLITMGLLILAGNTCYPVFLRFIVWVLYQITPEDWIEERQSLKFLMDHPRRCYTNLFPSYDTWWLLITVILLNGIDWAGFLILNVGNHALDYLPLKNKVIDGLFQAFAVRSGGFYVVSIPSLRIGTQVLYVIMMYISAFPVAITMRSSNVYEERTLGIYAEDIQHDSTQRERAAPITGRSLLRSFRTRIQSFSTGDAHHPPGTRAYFLQQQLRAQLAHDAWWLVLAVLFIMIIESSQFERDPTDFSVFNVIFEVVSGYGCVGISVGVPDNLYSFCGSWHILSKLILCAVMIRGRHRGLPVVIDMAVLLPGEWLDRAEEEDARIRIERQMSRER